MRRARRRHKSILPIVLVWAGAVALAVMFWFALVWLALKFWAN